VLAIFFQPSQGDVVQRRSVVASRDLLLEGPRRRVGDKAPKAHVRHMGREVAEAVKDMGSVYMQCQVLLLKPKRDPTYRGWWSPAPQNQS
jgi:hypothetical protein